MRLVSAFAIALAAAPALAEGSPGAGSAIYECTYTTYCENDACQALEVSYRIVIDAENDSATIQAFGRETAARVAQGGRSITLTWSSPLGGEMVTIDTQAFRAVHTNHMATDWAIDVQRMTGECRPTGQE